ncbi:MAG: endopeptidase La, partial [Firmicutes bacterium]|nr:endopeptidase La [Candidatus Stercoripulliclostridium pullicola]
LKNYLDTVIELPWGIYTEDNEDLKEAQRVLDEDHYGIEKVKERLIEALAVRKLCKEGRSPIICLVGPPGVGKTSIARSIARAMNKNYVRLSFGGVRDEAEIRGHRKTYVGAMPGRIITSIKTAGSMNPVFLMDEIDKMASDYKGDPASALLEVLDPEQNVNFRDHFLEVPFDLSKVLFITTANTLDTISRPLLDRMEIIEMSGYTDIEKKEIAKRYLVRKALKQNGVESSWIRITDDAIEAIIQNYTRESGVRALEKQINAVVRKVARRFVERPNSRRVTVSAKNIADFLGEPKYLEKSKVRPDAKGVVTGLAWTEVGGDTLEVEVAFTPGKGEILLTGSLGDVMKESARIALSYCRTHLAEWGISEEFFKEHDVHIHVPEGATPKDGPSAGITIATAVCSALTDKCVRGDVAMTGELTLRGKVLPIGGLKEKSLAALRDGVKTIYLPEDNRKDYKELPEAVKKGIDFRFVDNVGAVIKSAIIW